MRILAIDYGKKAIGLAITDELQLTIRPLTTIRRKDGGFRGLPERIGAIIAENGVGILVIGLPLNMDGTRGDAARCVERFIGDLRKVTTTPIVTVDERLTSREAEERLRASGAGARERRRRSDEYAAVIILEDYLAACNARRQPDQEII